MVGGGGGGRRGACTLQSLTGMLRPKSYLLSFCLLFRQKRYIYLYTFHRKKVQKKGTPVM